MTVMPGTAKVTFNGRDTDYESKKRAAIAQSQRNSYIQGVQDSMDGGFGDAVRGTRTATGPTNAPVGELIHGKGTFAYTDSPGNQPTAMNQTGSVDLQVSSTNVPHEDPDEMQNDAIRYKFNTGEIDRRLYNMAKGGQGFPGLNNRNAEA